MSSAIAFAGFVLPGEEEPWRRFIQELLGSRLEEYEGLRRRLGVSRESVWLMRSNAGAMAIAHLEAEEPERVVPLLASSQEPFDLWFKGRLLELHGCDLKTLQRRPSSELVVSHRESGVRDGNRRSMLDAEGRTGKGQAGRS